jgi:hypothetical protein
VSLIVNNEEHLLKALADTGASSSSSSSGILEAYTSVPFIKIDNSNITTSITTHKTVDNNDKNDNNDNELLMIKNTNVIATHKATSEQTKDKVDVNEKVYRQLSKFDSLFNLQTRTNAEDQKSEGISCLNKPKLLFFR